MSGSVGLSAYWYAYSQSVRGVFVEIYAKNKSTYLCISLEKIIVCFFTIGLFKCLNDFFKNSQQENGTGGGEHIEKSANQNESDKNSGRYGGKVQ